MGTVRVSLRVLGFIKFLDSIMHGYNYYTILVKCTCCLAHLELCMQHVELFCSIRTKEHTSFLASLKGIVPNDQ